MLIRHAPSRHERVERLIRDQPQRLAELHLERFNPFLFPDGIILILKPGNDLISLEFTAQSFLCWASEKGFDVFVD